MSRSSLSGPVHCWQTWITLHRAVCSDLASPRGRLSFVFFLSFPSLITVFDSVFDIHRCVFIIRCLEISYAFPCLLAMRTGGSTRSCMMVWCSAWQWSHCIIWHALCFRWRMNMHTPGWRTVISSFWFDSLFCVCTGQDHDSCHYSSFILYFIFTLLVFLRPRVDGVYCVHECLCISSFVRGLHSYSSSMDGLGLFWRLHPDPIWKAGA